MGTLGGGGGWGREVLIELLRSLQLSGKKREGGFTGLAHNSCQSTLHRSQWKFIFLIGYISFRIRLDSKLKLIRNYINPNGFAVSLEDTYSNIICQILSIFTKPASSYLLVKADNPKGSLRGTAGSLV